MSDFKLSMTNCDDKVIAAEARKIAHKFDPWAAVRFAALWALIGGALVAAMDYGDLWICVGACDNAPPAAQEGGE
ncbi:hypothetical protein JF540_12785 [Salipiger thiooxidans]|uniref:hypothetical protein n=1 Tax=Salipiger thiooxidans TaxID=282683 RepID=UPI001A8F197E|nr:hypothetical protein [Salipiger thiooxidans]MBN8187566.1 hypothetical protein [Salipiger thiooxidans]